MLVMWQQFDEVFKVVEQRKAQINQAGGALRRQGRTKQGHLSAIGFSHCLMPLGTVLVDRN